MRKEIKKQIEDEFEECVLDQVYDLLSDYINTLSLEKKDDGNEILEYILTILKNSI